MKSVCLALVLFVSISMGEFGHGDEELVPDVQEKELHFKPELYDPEDDVEKPGRRPRLIGTSFAHVMETPHGEQEIRVFFDEVIAMETVTKSRGERSLFYREVTDGKNLVTLIYTNADSIADCDVSRNRGDVKRFIARFLQTEVDELEFRGKMHTIDVGQFVTNAAIFSTGNSSFELLEHEALRQSFASMVDIDTLKSDCHDIHQLQRKIKEEREQIGKTGEYKTSRNTEGHSRNKRSMLVIPGTKWCGQGDSALSFDDLGEDVTTDRCCRDHDHCPHYIEGFETKYSLFNYRFSTISHCYCDESFRSCLKSANTDASQMVGNVFFNIIGMQCFEFRPKKVCINRSWWGTCQKYERQMQAEIVGTLAWE